MSLQVSRIRALCFDVDGTLSDTDDYYAGRFETWLKHMPFVSNPAPSARRLVMWLESPGSALLELADRFGMDGQMIGIVNWMNRRRRRRGGPAPVVAGVPSLLAGLRGRYPLAVISARDEGSTMAFLEARDLRKYFTVIVTALSARRTKPYADPIQLAAQQMGVAAEACLMIGDTVVDIRAGKAAGAQTVGVLCGFGEESELRRSGADLILPSTGDLGDELIAQWPGALT